MKDRMKYPGQHRSGPRRLLPLLVLLAPVFLAGCAAWQTPLQTPPDSASITPPAAWQSPLPHNGKVTDLAAWWAGLNDPLLVQLIEVAQASSGTLADAKARIAQARATRVGAGAARGPALDASASASRGVQQPGTSAANSASLGLQATWEADLFGGKAAASNAAQARLDGAQAAWHDARVSVAAEVAAQYLSQRNCEAQLSVTEADAKSRADSARLADLTAKAGFSAPATAQLARASAADAAARVTELRAQCQRDVLLLAALIGTPMADVQAALNQNPPISADVIDKTALFSISTLPAEVVAQRPDVFQAERDVAAYSSDVTSTDALRLPRLSLSGSIGAARVSTGGFTSEGAAWSIGPLAITLPLYDGGARAANVQAAQARYEAAVVQYRSKARQAIAEVEIALLNLQSTASRRGDSQAAAEGYRASFNATQARYKSGLASLVELEDARRTSLAAETALVSLQRERMAAWIALYRAAGGGWTVGSNSVNAIAATTAQTGTSPKP
jgi:outer membrane protein, multidrug efflux system